MRRIRTIGMRRFCFLFLVFFFFWIWKSPAEGVEIIAFGDSITKGFPYVEGRYGEGRRVGGYEPSLETLFETAGASPVHVYNYGVGGENTYFGWLRLGDVLDAHPDADYVLILEGTNDHRQLSVRHTLVFLEAMVLQCQNRGVQPVLGTLLPDTNHGEEKEMLVYSMYNPQIMEMAVRTQTPIADHYGAMVPAWPLLTTDGTHPNEEGYRIMAQVWFDALNFPDVRTLNAYNIGESTAVVQGMVNPKHLPTRYYVEYGMTTDYAYQTPEMDAGAGKDEIAVSVSLKGLSENTKYHFRLVAYNSEKISFGEDCTFQTLNKERKKR